MSQATELIAKQMAAGASIGKIWGTLVYNVKDTAYNAKGDGLIDDTTAITNTISAAAVNGGTVVFPPGTYKTGNFTVPSNVTLWFMIGAKLSINSGSTVTINGSIDAGIYQIFSGLGAVSGTPLIPCSYPEWFGGAGNMGADNYGPIQACIAISSAVCFQAGYYNMSNTITVTKSVTFRGLGKNISLIRMTDASKGAFVLNVAGCNIYDMGFLVAVTATAGTMIAISATACVLNNVWVKSCYIGVEFTSSGCHLVNMNIDNYVFYGLYLHDCNDLMLDNFIFNAVNSTGIGIRLVNNVQAFVASNGDILVGNSGMTMDAASNVNGSRPSFCKFVNVYFDSSQNGVSVQKCTAFRFIGCWFSNRPGSGCSVNTCEDVTFESCDFINNGTHGCFVSAGAKRTKFIGCSFVNNNSQNVGANGVVFDVGTTDFVAQGCTANNAQGFAGVQGYGIYVVAGASDRYIIADNLVSGNGTSGVVDSGTGVNKRVANNY